jgi:hypothetical protein
MPLCLLPQAMAAYAQDTSQQCPPRRGTLTSSEVTQRCNKREQRCPPWANSQDATDSPIVKFGCHGGTQVPPYPFLLTSSTASWRCYLILYKREGAYEGLQEQLR